MNAKIAYICADPGVPVFGRKGASVHVLEMLRAFGRAGAQVDLYASRLGGDPPDGLSAVTVHHEPVAAAWTTKSRERNCVVASERIAAALAGRGYNLVYERYSLWSRTPLEQARMDGATTVLEVNAPLIEEQATHRALAGRALAQSTAKAAFAAADHILAVSEEVAEWVRNVAPRAGAQVRVVPNAVDPKRFKSRYAEPAQDGESPFVVGFVGTLKPWHGVGILLEAFALLRRRIDARLLIVGDGPQRTAIEEKLAVLGLSERVRLTGAVDPDRVPSLLAEMDAAVASYPQLPGFYFSPLKVFEYMAAGLPVVASATGQIPNIVKNGVTGLLTPPGDAAALAEALERLATEPGLATALGDAGRHEVEANHSWDKVAAKVLAFVNAEQAQVA